MPMTAREAIKKLLKEGWIFVRQDGSHKVFKHPSNPLLISIPDHKRDLTKGLERDIKRKAGWK